MIYIHALCFVILGDFGCYT